MSTLATPKPKLRVKAEYIGPIMKLDGLLSDEKQNLIFARNGTGKSFLARALRLLDETALDGVSRDEVANLLVSAESPNRQGSFQLFEDTICIGSIGLNAIDNDVTFSTPRYIFHVFSEDYVTRELRQNKFELDGEITHEIIVGQENVLIDQKETEKSTKMNSLSSLRKEIDRRFEDQKKQLQKDFQINASLGSFKALKSEVYFEGREYNSLPPKKSVEDWIVRYNKFKALPSDPEIPQGVIPNNLGLSIDDIIASLLKITSPSSVADEVKQRIFEEPKFFESGLTLMRSSDPDCPFCTQTLTEVALSAISKYQEYFVDAEAKEKDALVNMINSVENTGKKVESWRAECLVAKSRRVFRIPCHGVSLDVQHIV